MKDLQGIGQDLLAQFVILGYEGVGRVSLTAGKSQFFRDSVSAGLACILVAITVRLRRVRKS